MKSFPPSGSATTTPSTKSADFSLIWFSALERKLRALSYVIESMSAISKCARKCVIHIVYVWKVVDQYPSK